MKIATLESLHCDAGTRNFDFLKLTTDTGLVGWSEYNETFGGPGLSAVIERLAPALKTNVLLFGDNPRNYAPGFARATEGFPELNPDRYVLDAIRDQLAAFREGSGPDMDILVDLNFNYKTEGYVKMAHALEPFDLLWMELDTRDAKALQYIRSRAPMPVASCESLFGRREYRPYFENYSVDVAIIDTPWNGVGESVKIANMADTYEINVAPHKFYGPLATMMSAHFCAVVPNLRIMETDPDTVPWHDDLVTVKPAIKDGHMSLPTGAGWGTEINEATVRAHPPLPR